MNGQTNASGGGGGYKEYAGQITLASDSESITIPNPFGSADKVTKVHIETMKGGSSNTLSYKCYKLLNTVYYILGGTSLVLRRIASLGTITINDTDIIIGMSKNLAAGDVYWEVCGVE